MLLISFLNGFILILFSLLLLKISRCLYSLINLDKSSYNSLLLSIVSNFLKIIFEINLIISLSLVYSKAILLFLSLILGSAFKINLDTICLLFFLQAICKAVPILPK